MNVGDISMKKIISEGVSSDEHGHLDSMVRTVKRLATKAGEAVTYDWNDGD